MAGEWKTARVSEIANVTDYVANGSFESLRNNVTYRNVPDYAILVRLVDRNAGWKGDFVYVDKASYDFLRKSGLNAGDIVIANVGANAGSVFRVPNFGMPMTLGPNAVLCRPKDEKVLRRDFLYYFLIGDEGQEALQSILSGSAQPKFNKTDFRSLSVPVPPLPEQRSIAHILGTLDDKIELNRQMNETLEAMARVLFKSWFVDFDPVRAKAEGRQPSLSKQISDLFPDSFEESELGEAPKGWVVGKIQDCCAQIHNGGTPRRNEPRYWDGGNIPWLASGEVRQPVVTATEGFITEAGLTESSAKWVPAYSTVIALYGATAGQVSLVSSPLTTNQAVCALVPKKDFALYNYLSMRAATSDLESKAVGSAQQNISKGIVQETQVILPPTPVIERFAMLVGPLFDRWIVNLYQSRTLAALRDTLLPKLISGELRGTHPKILAEAMQ